MRSAFRRGAWVAVAIIAAVATLSLVLAIGAPSPPREARAADESVLDQYGGVKVPVAKASGAFARAKVGNRWILVTPEGHAFWMLGVFRVDVTGSIDDLNDSYANRIVRKYENKYKWAEQTTKRLRLWGFNTIGEYASRYVLPVKSSSGNPPNTEKMAFVTLSRPSFYGLKNTSNFAPAPFKDLLNGTDSAVYTGWRGNGTPDVFDPNFQAYAEGALRGGEQEPSPWLIGVAVDDADNLVGFGPGPELPAARIHPHIGWIVLVTNFQQATNRALNITYADPKVYSKDALRDFLRTKYGTIASLNSAWGARYTSWDSDGGWPSGKGLLDESGRGPWVGTDFDRLTRTAPQVRSDLDAFLYEYAKRYFTVTAGSVRRRWPNTLVFGPATLNGWGGLTRGPILRAAGESVDVLQAIISGQRALDLTVKYAGDLPIVTWTGVHANSDSALWRHPHTEFTLKAQEERGRYYANTTAFLVDATTPSGVKPVVGHRLWAWVDSWGEKRNWGLVSFLDNAYDGKEAVRAPGKDPWGFPTGGEERDYGDFLSGVRRANEAVIQKLLREIGR